MAYQIMTLVDKCYLYPEYAVTSRSGYQMWIFMYSLAYFLLLLIKFRDPWEDSSLSYMDTRNHHFLLYYVGVLLNKLID